MEPSRLRHRALALVAVAALGVSLTGSSATAHGVSTGQVRTELAGAHLEPVRAGVVPDHLNPGLLAALARVERDRELRERLSARIADAAPESLPASASPSGDDGDATEPAREKRPEPPTDVREHAAAVLASLPGGDDVEIAWDHPDIGSHLGGVRLDRPDVMMLNSRRFEAEPERVEATVKHEIAHHYQGAVIAKNAERGDWWSGYWKLDAALQPVFGAKWMERSADCVAIELGADWTHYTAECSGKAKQRAVAALLEGRLP